MAGNAQGNQQGTTPHGHLEPDETKAGGNKQEESADPKRNGEATDENPSETTGSTESGREDKGAKA